MILLIKTSLIIITMFMVLLGSNFAYLPAQGQNMSSYQSYASQNCVNLTNMTTNYLTVTCTSELINTPGNISDIQTVTSTGWFVVTAWLERAMSSNSSSPTEVWVSNSLDGGQSYTTDIMVDDTNSSKRNLQLGISQEKVYATYEQRMGANNYDVFLVKSNDGGQNFTTPENISNSTVDTTNSILTVDSLTGKYIVTYLDGGQPSTTLINNCGMC